MTDEQAQEAHEEIARLRNERDILLAENARLRAAQVRAWPYVYIEASRYADKWKEGWVVPAVEALALIDAALALADAQPREETERGPALRMDATDTLIGPKSC